MALYEYRCSTCASVFEARRAMAAADDPITCPAGHVGAKRMLSVFASVGTGSLGGGGESAPAPAPVRGCGGGCACH